MIARIGGVAVVVLLGWAAQPAAGQVQGFPVYPDPVPSVAPPRGVIALPPVPVDGPPVRGQPVYPDPFPRPGPPPACNPEPACRDPFRYETRSGSVLTGFPQSLLWEPPLASKREPRLGAVFTTLNNDITQQTVDTAIGTVVGLLRYEPVDTARAWQLDVFGVVLSRFSQRDFFVAADYRAGLPITFACGPWHGKFGYEHTSTHLGDEIAERLGLTRIEYVKDELVFALGRRFFNDSLRLYGQVGWAFFQDITTADNSTPSPVRFDVGAEWYHRRPTGFRGQPFAAVDVEFNGAVGYTPNLTVQAGWQWRNPPRRLSQLRVFGEFYTGKSPFGQFYTTREQWFGLGLSLDY